MFNVHDCATGRAQSATPLTLEEAQKLIQQLIAQRPGHPYMIVTIEN